jgi:hypothetical protein
MLLKQWHQSKSNQRGRSNLEPALILALAKIRPRTEVQACQKQAQSSRYHVRPTLVIDDVFNHSFVFLECLCSVANFRMTLFNTLFRLSFISDSVELELYISNFGDRK